MKKNYVKITENFCLTLDKQFNSNSNEFDENLLDIVEFRNDNFYISLKFTIDNINYFGDLSQLPDDTNYKVCLEGLINPDSNNINNSLSINANIDNFLSIFTFKEITYNGEVLNYQLELFESIINKKPNWNFYDNQQITIQRWKDTIMATNTMYGHRMTYFKTEPSKTNYTFQNNYEKEISDIKKILISVPQNNLPTDFNIYSEWDYPMQDEFSFDIVDEVFKTAFGPTAVPMAKDIIYFPLINKMLQITAVQPKNGFMGQIGWWQCFVAIYNKDESINFSEEIKEAIDGTEFEHQLIDHFDSNSVIDGQKIYEDTIEEKIKANAAYSNRLVDSHSYIDLKETEKIRQYYHKRLAILSINPDEYSFPVTVYDCNSVPTRTIALIYSVPYKYKKKQTIEKLFGFTASIIPNKKFTGELFDFINESDLILYSINMQSDKLIFKSGSGIKTELTKLIENEYYEISVIFNFEKQKLQIQIHRLINKIKSRVFRKTIDWKKQFFRVKNINVYGGPYYYNEATVYIDNKEIFKDYAKPFLEH